VEDGQADCDGDVWFLIEDRQANCEGDVFFVFLGHVAPFRIVVVHVVFRRMFIGAKDGVLVVTRTIRSTALSSSLLVPVVVPEEVHVEGAKHLELCNRGIIDRHIQEDLYVIALVTDFDVDLCIRMLEVNEDVP